ncbi:PAS domain S-box protein [Tunicatimonas pelagia]|uniref:PAS domain S-box protein n=1 Tax=Tunicatimonas pelagia TaxID=931531 RepID=UPI002664FD19|nr:PAS domain S-box protein [Tunicatimonas pelagia]WKN44314.1 PAS domain S-box protein [Tunicatimonas pelagia]
MLKRINIGGKITASVLLLTALAVVAISTITYQVTEQVLESQYAERLQLVNSYKKSEIEGYFKRIIAELALIDAKQEESLVLEETEFPELPSSDIMGLSDLEEVTAEPTLLVDAERVKEILTRESSIASITLVSLQGDILFTSDNSSMNQQPGDAFYDPDGQTIEKSKEGVYTSRVFKENDQHFTLIGQLTSNEEQLAVAKINVAKLFDIVNDSSSLGSYGESFLVKATGKDISYINSSQLTDSEPLALQATAGSINQQVAQRAIEGNTGYIHDIDYRGEPTLAAWDYLPTQQWGIISKIDQAALHAELRSLLYKSVIVGVILLVVAFIISILLSRVLTSALLSLKKTLQMLSEGVLPEQVEKKSDDEVGQMAETTAKVVDTLQRTASFAHQIGAGKLDASFQPISEKDALGNALINMRDNIQNSEKRDSERNWIVTGVAEIGEILRAHDKIEPLGDAVVAYVCQKIGAIQGAFYVVNDGDETGGNAVIEMKASYAYNKKKYIQNSFKFAEGLVGQAAIEQDTLIRTEIPYDYVTITSGLLGDQRPESLLIVPLITNEQVYGVLEFAAFEKFSSRDVKFVEEISLITARTVFNIKVNERTRRLLQEAQQMSNELQEQQEILQQNAEEMQATQEELQRANKQLEEQIQEVERTQNRMASLLENASEVVTIYEDNQIIRYISPSVQRIFGYNQEELIGHSDMEHIVEEGQKTFLDMFSSLIKKPKESVTVQYLYNTKDRGEVWVETTGTNLLDDPAVQGIVLNSRDITERKRAEQEERMRSKMQALSENSTDLITRLDKEGTFFYINPTIETYTGQAPSEFLNKRISEASFEPSVVEEWLKILGEVGSSEQTVAKEIDFPSQLGDRVMNVNAIPEFDEEEQLESVLVVSHDITERKQIELEIQSKNKKINDSINYARRIQGAILPDNQIIKHVFPESFIFYKARDVVSGDFPWFMQRGEDTFIAAVDCTGHGVPGALISLIGYFLLNDIVRSRGVSDPGEILDQLDDGVTKTLRQDSDDSQSKDGMDIALCRIRKNEVQYAGAHRPLYFMNKGEMVEIKGDKFPIGGGIYKNQTNFTTTTIKAAKGDSIYFCSDGFPDQFGGPNNRKYGPKRLRAMIQEHHHKPMDDVHQTIGSSWEEWQGEEKQTDDVLMIGIKF